MYMGANVTSCFGRLHYCVLVVRICCVLWQMDDGGVFDDDAVTMMRMMMLESKLTTGRAKASVISKCSCFGVIMHTCITDVSFGR